MFSTSTTASTYPERSPLEPLSSYSVRLKKWKRDNAKWEGQRKAIQSLDKKKTPLQPSSDDPRLMP